MRSSLKGFSLLELLVVLAIITGTLLLVAPRLSGIQDKLALKQASRDLVSALRQTRLQAIRKGKPARLILHLDSLEYGFSWRQQRQFLPSNLKISMTTTEQESTREKSASMRFYPDGSASGGEIVLAKGQQAYAIQVDWLSGRVKLYD